MTQLIFHDFDYVDAHNGLAKGDVQDFGLQLDKQPSKFKSSKSTKLSGKKKKGRKGKSKSRSPKNKHGFAAFNDRSNLTLQPDLITEESRAPTFYSPAPDQSQGSREGSKEGSKI